MNELRCDRCGEDAASGLSDHTGILCPSCLDKIQASNRQEIENAKPYCAQDTLIDLKLVDHLRQKLQEERVTIKRLYTINQVAIQYLINKLKKSQTATEAQLFWNQETGEIRRTLRDQEIQNQLQRQYLS